jgi:hypothetical protein
MRLIDSLLGLETNKETTFVAMQWRGNHVSTAIKVLLKSVFSTGYVQRGYKEKSTSPVTLRVVGGDEKGKSQI